MKPDDTSEDTAFIGLFFTFHSLSRFIGASRFTPGVGMRKVSLVILGYFNALTGHKKRGASEDTPPVC